MGLLPRQEMALVVLLASTFLPLVLRSQQTGTTSEKTASGEAAPPGSKTTALDDAAKTGFPLSVVLPKRLADVATVEAVLIPPSVTKRIFGKEIAHNYAVIQLTVSNTDPNASLVLQSVFLDYSQWILSGLPMRADQEVELRSGLTSNQKPSKPWQVASVESRLVRGELLDAQQWTERNWTIRGLTALGSVGAGFVFPFSGDIAKGVAAFNGVLVPGAASLWPDGTVAQLNRISDFGFQTNKLVPKEASDIVVAFFPIERFLTPTFKQDFIHSPAGFFVPGEMLADPKMAPKILAILIPLINALESGKSHKGAETSGIPETTGGAKGNEVDAAKVRILQSLLKDCSTKEIPEPADAAAADQSNKLPLPSAECQIQSLINRISLNSIRLVIGGVMSVNVSSVPPSIYEVDFDDDGPDIWSKTGTKHGVILGTYLSGGNPVIVDDQGNAIDGLTIKGVTQGSDDRELHFEMTVTKCVPPNTKVRFQVVKPSDEELAKGTTDAKQPAKSNVSGVSSMLFDYPLSGYSCTSAGAATNQDGTIGSAPAPPSDVTDTGEKKTSDPQPDVKPAAKPTKPKKEPTRSQH